MPAEQMHDLYDTILILDFGSQVRQLACADEDPKTNEAERLSTLT